MARILLVEDEHEIRSIAAELMREDGYDVVEAASGDLASSWLQTAPGLDALVTDVHMPGRLDGLVLARLFRERHPEGPVLYVTGNPGALRDVPMRKNKDVVIAKPYRMRDVIRMLRAVLSVTPEVRSEDALPAGPVVLAA